MATSQSSKRSAANPYSTGGRSAYQVAPRRRAPRYSGASATQADPGYTYGGPATRQVAGEAGTSAEASYPRYQVPTGVEAGEQEIYGGTANAPSAAPSERISTPEMMTERQGVIANRALGPMRERGTLFGDLLGGLSAEKANPNFDPNAPIGGENVPYQGTSGLRGFFQRFGGNRANELNLGAQSQQAAEWKAEDTLAKERKAKIDDYRTQKGIDAEIATASDEKKRAHEVAMLEKTQQAQREVIKAQQDFTGAQNDKERAEAWKRLESAQTHAVSMQNNALAATAAEGAAGRQLQTDIANLRVRSDDFLARNAVHFGPNGMYSRGSDIFMTTTPMPDKSGKMPLPESINLTGPRGEGEQVPQISVGGTAPSMGARGVTTQPRSSGGRLFDILEGNETSMEPEATAATAQPVPVDQSTLGPTPSIPGAALPKPVETLNAPRFGPFLMEEFHKRAKSLAKDSSSRPNAADPLMLPMFENIAKSLGIGSEGVGASRQVRRPGSAVVERDLGSYLPKFGQLPQEEQNAAVIDALTQSMKQPRYRTTPNWEYNYNAR